MSFIKSLFASAYASRGVKRAAAVAAAHKAAKRGEMIMVDNAAPMPVAVAVLPKRETSGAVTLGRTQAELDSAKPLRTASEYVDNGEDATALALQDAHQKALVNAAIRSQFSLYPKPNRRPTLDERF